MAKFNRGGASPRTTRGTVPLGTTNAMKLGFEGNVSPELDTKTDLFNMATASFVAEAGFYQGKDVRLARFVGLIHNAVKEDPEWVARFIPWLRDKANIRTASVVAAAEAVAAGHPSARAIVSAALLRADEPGELVGYWHTFHGRAMPQALRKGLADAAVRLYTERSVLRYDTGAGVRFGDVIELSHAKPKDEVQSVLFAECLARRHNRERHHVASLHVLRSVYEFDAIEADSREAWLDGNAIPAEVSWERVGGWLPNGWNATAWERVIPNMGYMALLRNLNNFERAGISEAMQSYVCTQLKDPAQVAASRQFPYRFYSAYKASIGTTYHNALDVAGTLSCSNVPQMSGRTLVLVDVSASMDQRLSDKAKMSYAEVARLMAAAWSLRNHEGTDVVCFGTISHKVPLDNGSLMYRLTKIRNKGDGHGTEFWPAIQQHYNGHDRVIIFTDGQIFGRFGDRGQTYSCPTYTWNLAGYDTTIFHGEGKYTLSGFTDNSFRLIPLVEAQQHTTWEQLFAS